MGDMSFGSNGHRLVSESRLSSMSVGLTRAIGDGWDKSESRA